LAEILVMWLVLLRKQRMYPSLHDLCVC